MIYPVKQQWIPGLPEEPYRNGVGCWEGVVMHFTDNYQSDAASEAAFMSRNWQNAFVHEFIDPDEIIQVANPQFRAWGAGPKANPRFIHLELCVAHSQAEFDRSFDMWCQRAAYYLAERKLGVIRATRSGDGTLWGHFEVTAYLGGTDHLDPLRYLQGWGVSWDDVLERVQQHYDVLTGVEKVEKKTNFSDVPAGHWAENVIAVVSSPDVAIMTGYEDGTFRPDQPVTRAELAKVVNDLLYLIRTSGQPEE